ncbi:MAG: hypothetical protein E6H01_13740 [Bacillati bacterium ANGP1]|uniref:Uncharacterized protein n=1 Tax=Candidatus Segetimicrobium genomatis TaxID=2569760 RepID=A0A537KLE8_9BACT|nr:MAG: hypothetical protein E6H01_13740 [Terrabacteria group bacterium ANGP1]
MPTLTPTTPTSPVIDKGKANKNAQWIVVQRPLAAMVASWVAPSPTRAGCARAAAVTSSAPTSKLSG